MKKLETLKSYSNDDDKTKQKLPLANLKTRIPNTINQKPTLAPKNRSYNQLASKLISQSAVISQQSSHVLQPDSDSIIEIDPLCIYGNIVNIRDVDEIIKNKYQINQGLMFDVQDYIVIFAGRHQVQFKNGLPVCLYVPPFFKSARDSQTRKIQVLIQRKMHPQLHDPLQYPYVIVDPLNSIYPTYICSWIQCKRKITLQHYIQYNQQITQPLAIGNCIHRYLQWLIRKQVQPNMPTQNQISKLYQSYIYDMYIIDLQYQLFIQRVEQGIVNLVTWYQQHVIKGKVIQLNKWQKKYLKITRTLGSEVMIKSKYFGIRGKVDGLFEGQFINEKLGTKYDVAIPFQLKTGRKILDSHKKQIDFYNLLLRQNKNMPVIGLLYYSQSNLFDYRVENPMICFENINIHRNKIIINIHNLYSESLIIKLPLLPQTLDQCRLCDVTIQCAINRLSDSKLKELKDIQDIGEEVPEKYSPDIRKKISNLSVLQFVYLKKWTELLHLQQYAQRNENLKNSKKQFYNKIKAPLSELQRFSNYIEGQILKIKLIKNIQGHEMSEQLDNYFKVGQKLRIFIPLIRLADCCRINSTSKSTKKFQMQVQIKNQNVKFDKRKCGFLVANDQFDSIDVEMEKYQNSFYNYTRGYCYKFVQQAQPWLKSIVIQQNYQQTSKLTIKQQIKQIKNLNEDQAKAFMKCIQLERFCLVQGMPGTGKTQLILKLIQYFYSQGKSILVTSFTNQALTNILDRQINIQKKVPTQHIIREGSKYGITSQFEHLSSQSQQHQTIQHYKNYFRSKKVWFVTISSLYIQHLPKKFDVVIIDQASQCLEANCLQALLKANKFILIGDERQLQPVVKSKQALQKGMQISLFEKLCRIYKNNKATLKKQYRMSPAIMNLTNNLVYGGQLQLAQSEMKARKLDLIPNWKNKTPQYLYNIIDPQKSLRFINYDSALNLFSAGDKVDLRKIKRLLQIRIACSLYKQFLQLGVKKQSILIISAYNSLVHQLVSALKKQKLIQSNNSQVLTIDKSQGTDKQVIIFIFHKGNRELIENYRRLNVALTRARNKFVIVGSQKQLSQLATWTGRLATLLQPDQINIQRDFLQALLQ